MTRRLVILAALIVASLTLSAEARAVNVRAVGERGDPAVMRRYDEVARTLTGDPEADARAGVSWVRGLCAEMEIPPLREAGLSVGDCGRLIPLARRASSMRGNPVELSDEELRGVLEAAL